ncbi:MAG TPA: hypothetical protein VD769_02235 [Gaiellaceae bacterium]|nr:hypothetical protein [Gaiellaceae bacterium]
MRRTALTAAAVVVVLAIAACGGDGDDEAETQFIAQVNAICADYGPKLALIPPPSLDVDEWAAVGGDMADLLEASVNKLQLIAPPEDLDEDFGDWLGLRAEMAAAMREVQAAGGLHDEPAVDVGLQRINEAMETADPLAVQLGFEECSPTGIDTGEDLHAED